MQVHLERVDRGRNCFRFYTLALEPTLFGDIALITRWGRIGTRGRQRIRASGQRGEMGRVLADITHRKLRRGYRVVEIVAPTGVRATPFGAVLQGVDRAMAHLHGRHLPFRPMP